jgi:multimeric flavodoxin WrbA
MNIHVLNGSPKGKYSVTSHYCKYLEIKFPDCEFTLHHIGKNIRMYERSKNSLQELTRQISEADLIIWCFGVYIEMVPCQLKRFIELIIENGLEPAFTSKGTVSISTSAKWFDNHAHDYIHGICDDFQMSHYGFFSALPEDIVIPKEQRRLEEFFGQAIQAVKAKEIYISRYGEIKPLKFTYSEIQAGPEVEKIDNSGIKIIVLSDCGEDEKSLRNMIDTFKGSFFHKIEEIALNDLKMNGGCMACFQCAYDNRCAYEKSDDQYNEILNKKILKADVLIWAGAIKDRHLSAKWKMFLDRNFVYGHIPIYRGKQLGYIISGRLSQAKTLRDSLEQGQDWHRSNVITFISDEIGSNELIGQSLYLLAQKSVQFARNKYIKSSTFAHVGISKLIRDDIWKVQRSVMKADHRYYKKHRLYDFPRMSITHKIFGFMFNFRWFRKNFYKKNMMKDILLEPHIKLLKDMEYTA